MNYNCSNHLKWPHRFSDRLFVSDVLERLLKLNRKLLNIQLELNIQIIYRMLRHFSFAYEYKNVICNEENTINLNKIIQRSLISEINVSHQPYTFKLFIANV